MRHVGIGSCWFEFSARSQWTRSTKIGSSTVGRGRGKTSCFKLGHGRGCARWGLVPVYKLHLVR